MVTVMCRAFLSLILSFVRLASVKVIKVIFCLYPTIIFKTSGVVLDRTYNWLRCLNRIQRCDQEAINKPHIEKITCDFKNYFNTSYSSKKISTGRAFSYCSFLVTRFISLVSSIKSFQSITQLRSLALLAEDTGVINLMRSYISWAGSRKVMVLVFSKGVALCVGKGFEVVFGLIFSMMSSFFSVRSSTAYLKAKQ